jgi:hypothetical protein
MGARASERRTVGISSDDRVVTALGSLPRYTAADVIDSAREAGYDFMNERLFASWREARLVPSLQRTPGERRRFYTDPDLGHLLAACRWRTKTTSLHVVRIKLWIDGYPQEFEDLHRSLLACFNAIDRLVASELDRAGRVASQSSTSGVQVTAYDVLGAELARARGRRAIPRYIRLSRAERGTAYAYLLRMAIEGDSRPPSRELARITEKAMGLLPGRRSITPNAGPWLTGSPTEISQAAPVIGIPAVKHAVRTATGSELADIRGFANTLTLWVPELISLLGVWFRDPNPAGLGNLQRLDDPDIAPYLVAVLVSIRRDPVMWANLNSIADSLRPFRPLGQRLMALRILDQTELGRRLGRLDPAIRTRTQDILRYMWRRGAWLAPQR